MVTSSLLCHHYIITTPLLRHYHIIITNWKSCNNDSIITCYQRVSLHYYVIIKHYYRVLLLPIITYFSLPNLQRLWPSSPLALSNSSESNAAGHSVTISVLQNGELSFPNGRNSISIYFFSKNPTFRTILFLYTNSYLCTKFGGLKPPITCFWARRRNKVPEGKLRKLRLYFDQFLINVSRSS